MVRGYQKRVIHLKNTESDAFEEAFFLVSERGAVMCERQLIAEANRIIEESVSDGRKRNKGIRKAVAVILAFIGGVTLSSLFWILLTIV